MANATILEIPRSVTQPDLDASAELQSASLGSGQFPLSALRWPLAWGTFTIPSATATLFTINFNASGGPLEVEPSALRLTKMIPSSAAVLYDAWVVGGWNATSFALEISGPVGDTNHKVYCEALP